MQARIGVIGAGYWAASFYLPFLRDHPHAEIVGVVRRYRDEGLGALRREYDLAVATDSVEELLAAGCDGVIVASPHNLHCRHATMALEAGAHVLVEKPMTVTLQDSLALEAVAQLTGRGLAVAHGWNFSQMVEWGSALIADGTIGPPTWITGVMSSSLVDLFSGTAGYGTVDVDGYTFEAQPETWADPSAGGGYIYGQLSHELGVALSLIRSEPRLVFARTNVLTSGVDIDAQVTVEFADGVVGSFSGHGRAPRGVRYPLEVRVAATNGVLTLDFERDRAEAHIGSAPATDSGLPSSGDFLYGRPPDAALDLKPGAGLYSCAGPAQWLIHSCLDQPSPNRAPAELGRRAVAIMQSAVISARSGRPVDVESLKSV